MVERFKEKVNALVTENIALADRIKHNAAKIEVYNEVIAEMTAEETVVEVAETTEENAIV